MRYLRSLVTLAPAVAVLAACGSGTSGEDAALASANAAEQASLAADAAMNNAIAVVNRLGVDKEGAASAAVNLSDADRIRVCKAGIAMIMGKSPSIMKAKADGDIIHNQYERPDDGKLWKQDCRIEGNRIHWRGVDSFGASGPGRWRDSAEDEVLTYTLDGSKVKVVQTYSDGSKSEESYTIKG